jgi:hypothetical protein
MIALEKPTHEEILAAIDASGEFDSSEVHNLGKWGDGTGRACAGCGEVENDGGDDSYDGTRRIAVPADNLTHCGSVDCDCLAHRDCLVDGLCPHCVRLCDVANARHLMRFVEGLTLDGALGQLAAADRRTAGVRE